MEFSDPVKMEDKLQVIGENTSRETGISIIIIEVGLEPKYSRNEENYPLQPSVANNFLLLIFKLNTLFLFFLHFFLES